MTLTLHVSSPCANEISDGAPPKVERIYADSQNNVYDAVRFPVIFYYSLLDKYLQAPLRKSYRCESSFHRHLVDSYSINQSVSQSVSQSINISRYINVHQKVIRELTNLVCRTRGITKTERNGTETHSHCRTFFRGVVQTSHVWGTNPPLPRPFLFPSPFPHIPYFPFTPLSFSSPPLLSTPSLPPLRSRPPYCR